ncbi:MAG: DUF5808 domain-containing protein [Acidimicrobiia bacterium]|nr:DUF5808 domain-containing protein [Acidimicrobiia bacterium]
MSKSVAHTKRRRSDGMKPLKLLAAALAIAAVVKELRTPKEERTWHGSLGGFVPYDFRMPTVDKIKRTFWNPDGAVLVNRAFGVGWTINLGAVVAKVRSMSGTV